MNPIVIIVPMLMLGKKKKRKRTKRMLGDLSHSEASSIMSKESLSPQMGELSRRIDFECYDCELEDDLGMPLAEYDPDDDDDDDDDDDESDEVKEKLFSPDEDDVLARCDKFLDAIYIRPAGSDELSINEIAVKKTILPAMEKIARDIRKSSGGELDAEDHGMQLVLAGLEAVAPGCGWAFHEDDSAWTYAFGEPVAGRHVEVLESMFPLAVATIDKINEMKQANDG